MRTTFARLFLVTALVISLAFIGLGMSFRMMVRDYLKSERIDDLQSHGKSVVELVQAYQLTTQYPYSGWDLERLLRQDFQLNLYFSSQVSGTDVLICDPDGQVCYCSCSSIFCQHRGMYLDEAYLRAALADEVRTGSLPGIYDDNRYLVARSWGLEDGTTLGLVVVSEPVQDMGDILSRITQMFSAVAVAVLFLAVIAISVFSQNLCKPLRDMSEAAREFGHGNLKARVPTGGKNTEEIDELALAFNNMAQSLEASEYRRQEFVANVSHELKTPMTTIGGYVDGVLDGTIPREKNRQYLTLVSEEVKRLSRLVHSMLEISRLQDQSIAPEQMRHFDVTECLGQVLITFEQKINEKHLEVEADFPEYTVYARGNLDSITQVVYNLMDNAVKFCDPGGTLGVKLTESGQKVYVSISNTGQTIPPEELPLIFDRFHKLDKSRSQNRDGWGLGLYIVKTIIGSHGEDISATSRDGRTQFTFTLTQVHDL